MLCAFITRLLSILKQLSKMQLGQKLSTNLPSVSSWSNLSEISEASNGDVDTRSADEIFILKKSILDSSQNDFIEAILSDKLGY